MKRQESSEKWRRPDTSNHNAGPQPPTDYSTDPLWRNKRLTPSQLLVHDIRLEAWQQDRQTPLLEIRERVTSSLVPQNAALTPSSRMIRAADAANNPIEQQKFSRLEEEYGWMHTLRIKQVQKYVSDPDSSSKLRWIHCSSKFPDYLEGCLWAISDDSTRKYISTSLRLLENAMQRHTRFSKHGKFFAPFYEPLQLQSSDATEDIYPMLISVPFLDWTINGQTPPLRFQVDKREGFQSTRSSSHLLRSILQHFYRLEDTVDREKSQVFSRHKPWSTDRELDLKIRQWYGHHPTGLNVDELWILLIDAEHIVTFSSNQTWKSRWPPLQLTSRISDVSFRGLRNTYYMTEQRQDYTAATHMIACLSGAVGMLHRNFWTDIVLCLTDRYAGYLGHLQYRLHRSPSTKLVMDLIQCQEELNIVIQITKQQLDLITELQAVFERISPSNDAVETPTTGARRPMSADYAEFEAAPRHRATYRQLSTSTSTDPVAQLVENLQRELIDLQDLRDNTNNLVTRTIQLVNIRLEDHGKAILVFTVVTIVFLPLNFVCSFFGMNVSDIRNMQQGQSLFWAVALCVTAAVVGGSVFMAFQGGHIIERFLMWKDTRRQHHFSTVSGLRRSTETEDHGFHVHGVAHGKGYSW